MAENLPGRSLLSGGHTGRFGKDRSAEAEIAAGVWLHLHLDGHGTAIDGRDTIIFRPNEAQLVVEAEKRPMTVSVNAQEQLNAVSLYMPLDEVGGTTEILETIPRINTLSVNAQMAALAKRLMVGATGRISDRLRCRAAALELFSQAFDCSETQQRQAVTGLRKQRDIVEAVSILVNEDMARMTELKEIAAVLGVSSWRIRSAFKTITGNSYSLWLASARFERAQNLLADPAVQVAEVAYAVGYKSPATFATSFLRATGMSPTIWRNTQRTHNSREVWPGTSRRQ